MKKVYVAAILVLAVFGFGLQPTKGKAVPVSLAALHSLPATLGAFHEIDNNDAELMASPAYTDGSQGLQRDYRDDSGQVLNLYVALQTIGQSRPPLLLPIHRVLHPVRDSATHAGQSTPSPR